MNIHPAPGLSSRSLFRLVGYGPHLRRSLLREFWQSYELGGDHAYTFQTFVHLTSVGQVINYQVTGFDRVLARFGLEISVDDQGAYVTVLYLEGVDLADYADQVAWLMWKLAAALAAGGEPRARVKGRKGWRRWLRRIGIDVDESGMVSGWQAYFDMATRWRQGEQ